MFGIPYPQLKYMDLSNKKLYGELSVKCNLTRLNISNNKISGTLPLEFWKATKLQVFDLSPNHLVRKIPKELGQLKILFNLKLNNNNLIQ